MKINTMERVVPAQNIGRPWREVGAEKGANQSRVPPNEADEVMLGPVDEMLTRAVQDATQACDPTLRWEALAWLWVCCPDVADQLLLPWPELIDMQQKAADYLYRYPAF